VCTTPLTLKPLNPTPYTLHPEALEFLVDEGSEVAVESVYDTLNPKALNLNPYGGN